MNFSGWISVILKDFKTLAILLPVFFSFAGTAFPQADSLTSFSPSIGPEINLFVRFIFGLAIVIILLILTLWLLRHLMSLRTSGMAVDAVDVISIRYLEQKKAVALVRVLERVLIVGFSDNSVSLLGELTPEEVAGLRIAEKKTENPFSDVLKKIMSKKNDRTENS